MFQIIVKFRENFIQSFAFVFRKTEFLIRSSFHNPVKTARAARVTGAALLIDQKENGVLVAIDPDFANMLDVAAGRALVPELAT